MNLDRARPRRWRLAVAFGAVGVIWGSAWIPTASLALQVPALSAGVLRFALAAIVLGAVALVVPRRPLGRLILPAAVLGLTLLSLPYALTAWAAGRVSPGLVALFYGLMPLLVLMFEGGNRDGFVPAVALGIGGVAMVVAPGLSFHWEQAGGAAALVGAVMAGGFSLLYVRRLYAGRRLATEDVIAFSSIQMGFASLYLLVLLVSTGRPIAFPIGETEAFPLALLAVVVSGGTLPLLFWLLSSVSAWRVATLQWVATVVAVAEAAVMLRASPSLEGWIGAALVPGCILWIFFGRNFDGAAPVTLHITADPFPGSGASDIQGESE